jgi:hypothetical protein
VPQSHVYEPGVFVHVMFGSVPQIPGVVWHSSMSVHIVPGLPVLESMNPLWQAQVTASFEALQLHDAYVSH